MNGLPDTIFPETVVPETIFISQKKIVPRKLILVRHMEIDRTGSADCEDPPISKAGRQKAAKLIDALRTEPIEHIYSSDLKRAHQTAQIIADSLGVPLDLRSQFRELPCTGPEALRAQAQIATDAIDDIAVQNASSAVLIVAHSGTIRAITRHLLQLPLGIYEIPSIANGSILIFQKNTSGTWTSAG